MPDEYHGTGETPEHALLWRKKRSTVLKDMMISVPVKFPYPAWSILGTEKMTGV